MEASRNLRRLRKNRRLTQKDVAEILEVSNVTVSRWERLESKPLASLRRPYAMVLGVTVEHLEGIIYGGTAKPL